MTRVSFRTCSSSSCCARPVRRSYLAGPPVALQKPVIAAAAVLGRLRGYKPRYD